LYDYYPIGAAGAIAEFTGGRLKDHWENLLSNVFDPNPYRQRGGWFLGFTHNMHFDIELNDDYPQTITQGRITNITVNGKALDQSKTYTLASCYPHGNPVDEVCRTTGATNVRFVKGTERTTGPADLFGRRPLDINGPWTTVKAGGPDPEVGSPAIFAENIFNWARFVGGGALFLKVAPDHFAHPVDALRRYLAAHVIDESTDGLGRVSSHCVSKFGCTPEGAPYSEFGGNGIVQATQGAGPAWLKREFVTPQDNQNQQ
jgi:S-sulfosulfanyl-L-cysteine sulfohydrolase